VKFTKREITSSGGASSDKFLKLKDGESIIGVFRGEVYEFYQIWENGKSKVVDKGIQGAKSRFRLNFIDKDLKAKVFEFGLTIYNQLADIADDYNLEQTALKISRRGAGTDTVYMLIPAKEQPSAAMMAKIQAVPLNILEHKDAKPSEALPPSNSEPAEPLWDADDSGEDDTWSGI
jgi:hypothetical protein